VRDISERDDRVLTDDDSDIFMDALIQATTPDTPKPLCMCRRLPLDHDSIDQTLHKRQRTKAYSPDFTMDEGSHKNLQTQEASVEVEASFTTVIEGLQADKEKLNVELAQWRIRAEGAEEQVAQLGISLSEEREKNAQKLALLAEHCANINLKSSQAMERLFEGLRFPLSTQAEPSHE
jgi:hypothetical protein